MQPSHQWLFSLMRFVHLSYRQAVMPFMCGSLTAVRSTGAVAWP